MKYSITWKQKNLSMFIMMYKGGKLSIVNTSIIRAVIIKYAMITMNRLCECKIFFDITILNMEKYRKVEQ